jgi:hypothetical protein
MLDNVICDNTVKSLLARHRLEAADVHLVGFSYLADRFRR